MKDRLRSRVDLVELIGQINHHISQHDAGLQSRISDVVALVPKLWCEPEGVSCHISIGVREFESSRFDNAETTISSEFASELPHRGLLEASFDASRTTRSSIRAPPLATSGRSSPSRDLMQ